NGYKQKNGTDRFRTIMAYDCVPTCPRIAYFSNPAVTYHSSPVGIDSNSPQGADNARTLNNTRHIVANFRSSMSTSIDGGRTDTAPPLLTLRTPSQMTSSTWITISGFATDARRGGSGISSITVNGVRASNDTVSASGITTWSRTLALSPGSNTIMVVATDGSPAANASTATVSILVLMTS